MSDTFRIINVMASSVDGFVAEHDNQSDSDRLNQGFTDSNDTDHFKEILQTADAVILGSQTLIAGGGVLKIPRNDGTYPIWVTFTNRGIPKDHEFWQHSYAERWLVSQQEIEASEGVSNIVYGDENPVEVVISRLKSVGCKRVLLFGGGKINQLFYENRKVDELILTLCPILIANTDAVPLVNAPLSRHVKLKLRSAKPAGNLIFLHYEIL